MAPRRVVMSDETTICEGLLALKQQYGEHVAGITPWLVKAAGSERDGIGMVVEIVMSFMYYDKSRESADQHDGVLEIIACQNAAMSDLLSLLTDDQGVLADAHEFIDYLAQKKVEG